MSSIKIYSRGPAYWVVLIIGCSYASEGMVDTISMAQFSTNCTNIVKAVE